MVKRIIIPVVVPSKVTEKEFASKEIIIDGKKMIALSTDIPKERKVSSLLKAIPANHIK